MRKGNSKFEADRLTLCHVCKVSDNIRILALLRGSSAFLPSVYSLLG